MHRCRAKFRKSETAAVLNSSDMLHPRVAMQRCYYSNPDNT